MSSPQEILKSYWGFDRFRPLQEEIIQDLLGGKDVLALLPTGGGKSRCYQVPALALPGFCLVVSPLIALMKDQVAGLEQRGIPAEAIHTGMYHKEVVQILERAVHDRLKLLYVSPERIGTALFQEYLPGMRINLLAVDEAHCISSWGYDFRPAYRRIAELREQIPPTPVLALTATATPAVQADILEQLRMDAPGIFQGSLLRANLSFSVLREDDKPERLSRILERVKGSSIVYCSSRKATEHLARRLGEQGIKADYYHGGMPPALRGQKQNAWMSGAVQTMVCTNAFGMGIDKPDVRLVLHYDVPDSLENYYQEAGRAGRDGERSHAILLFDDRDLHNLEQLPILRYPGEQVIREVYRDLVHFLQIPANTGEMEWYPFQLDIFLERFGRTATTTLYAMKALEQEELLLYAEQTNLPARLCFTTAKSILYRFQDEQPIYTPLIEALLRTYPGIFDQPVPIFERQLARILRTAEDHVSTDLQYLNRAGLVMYQPPVNTPQIRLLQPRLRFEDLRIDYANYSLRKEECAYRVARMIGYLEEKDTCRSQFINRYFGETGSAACGICDVCLGRHLTALPHVQA